jgi:alpha-tubulin suppressor-like RCC1 family protein
VIPSGLSNIVALAEGGIHSLALKSDGTVIAWGTTWNGAAYVPEAAPVGLSNVVAIAAGTYHSVALKEDGTVVAWGDIRQTNVRNGLSNVIAISAGGLALKADGTVVSWRTNEFVQVMPLSLTNIAAIAGGTSRGLALKRDGTVVGWGTIWNGNGYVPDTVPAGLNNVVAIAQGEYSLALIQDGTLMPWGLIWNGSVYVPASVPPGLSNIVGIASGDQHTLALKNDGTAVAWGTLYSSRVPATVPAGLTNIAAIAAGGYQSLFLLRQDSIAEPGLEIIRGDSSLELRAHGTHGVPCQLLRATNVTGPWLPTSPFSFTNSMQQLSVPNSSAAAQFFRLLRR